jgi:DNA-binding NtrC family response regulator
MHHTRSQQSETTEKWSLLVVEDDHTTSDLVCEILERQGLAPIPCHSVRDAEKALREDSRIGAMLIDIGLPDGDGIDLIRSVHQFRPKLPCFVLTAKDTVESAVLAMKAGATDYFTKPFDPEALVTSIRGAMAVYRGILDRMDNRSGALGSLRIWKSASMRSTLESAAKAAKNASPVLITGRPNTGKGLIARWIHEGSSRKNGPFITINPAILTASQLSNELFGTSSEGTNRLDQGRLGKNRGGTVHLENIDILNPSAQVALLAWLNVSHTESISNSQPCRLIASSAANLDEAIQNNRFRQDLWYATAIYQVQVPSLSERSEDLPLLCEQIITGICVAGRLRRPSLTRKALEMIIDHTWPGNLSELHNVLEHAVTHTNDGLIGPDDLPRLFNAGRTIQPGAIPAGGASIDEITKVSLVAALESCQGNRRRAAQRLQVSLRTVYNMIQRYDLATPRPKDGNGC